MKHRDPYTYEERPIPVGSRRRNKLRTTLETAFTAGKAVLVCPRNGGGLSPVTGAAYYIAKAQGLQAHSRRMEAGILVWASKPKPKPKARATQR